MTGARIPVTGLVWAGLTIAYLACAACGERQAALAVVGLMAGTFVAAAGHRLSGLLAGVALAVAAWHFFATVAFLVFVPPLAAFGFMAVLFASTLRAGAQPLISRIARREDPALTPEVMLHTRRLTATWSACFAALFLAALGLAPFLSIEAWSLRVQILGIVVPGTLFLGEYAWRHHRFPHRKPGSLALLVANVVVVLREIAMESGRTAVPGGRPR